MKTLIVGYGSIGRVHAKVLRPLSSQLGIVTAQEAAEYPLFRSFDAALEQFRPDYVVICTVTTRHAANLAALKAAGFTGKVLVEKPLFITAKENDSPYPFTVYTGYHLRFHKVIRALKEALAGRQIVYASAHAGQHLSGWWPGVDPRQTYSAYSAQGGGVMRDLSHELDLAQFLFGRVTASSAAAERTSNVTVDSEDTATFHLTCERCSKVNVQLNYLDKTPRRDWVIETDQGKITADLIRRTLTIGDKTQTIACESHEAYQTMHEAVLANGEGVCTLEEAVKIVEMIDAASVTVLEQQTA